MNRSDFAGELIASGYNCGQAAFLAFADDLEIERRQAARLSNCLGGGFSGTGGVCGAVSGACLALSGRYGRQEPSREGEHARRQEQTYGLVQELQRDFAKKYGSVQCKALLEQGLAASGEQANPKYLCPEYVRYAAALAERSFPEPMED